MVEIRNANQTEDVDAAAAGVAAYYLANHTLLRLVEKNILDAKDVSLIVERAAGQSEDPDVQASIRKRWPES